MALHMFTTMSSRAVFATAELISAIEVNHWLHSNRINSNHAQPLYSGSDLLSLRTGCKEASALAMCAQLATWLHARVCGKAVLIHLQHNYMPFVLLLLLLCRGMMHYRHQRQQQIQLPMEVVCSWCQQQVLLLKMASSG